jgi:hypothetical protein
MTNYPILTSYLSDVPMQGRQRMKSDRQVFLDVVVSVSTHFANGSIPNVDYKGAKDLINRHLDKAEHAIRAKHVHGNYQKLPEPVRKFHDLFGIVYLHTVRGLIKRGEAIKGCETHPYRVEMLALLRDVAPLADMMATLKGDATHPTMIVKRVVKPVEEREKGYQPPKVNSEAEKQVVALLEQVTERSYENLKAQLNAHYHNGLKTFLEAQAEDAKLSPYDFFVGQRRYFADYDLYTVVEKVRGEYQSSNKYVAQDAKAVARIFLKQATEVADEFRMAFVHKNFAKIASIVDGKKVAYKGVARSHTVSLTGLEGTFDFTFKDGSSFTVVNKVVQARSVNGKLFHRWPLTFHEVVLPNGERMGKPSQERMNTVFLGK